MLNKFITINKIYRGYTDSFLRNGKLPLKETTEGFWGISISEEIFELFKTIRLENYKNFLDLGSGDGRVVAVASLFTNATGIEIDNELYETSLKIKKELGLNYNLINKDFYKFDISKFDIVYCFPDNSAYKFEKKLTEELNGRLILFGSYSKLNNINKEKEIKVGGSKFLVYSNKLKNMISLEK